MSLPYAVAVCANPDAIPVVRARWHAAHCVCGGVLNECSALNPVREVAGVGR